jgi:hypothetical protein
MATRDNGEQLPHSPGNEGARGSHGQANRGADAADNPNEAAETQLPDEGKEDLRGDRDAQGGGGVSSDSSRSRNI